MSNAESYQKGDYRANHKTFKNHIDGVNLLDYLTGKATESPRPVFIYFSDDGDVMGVRWDNWKIVFMEQRCPGTFEVWGEPFTRLRVPKLINLRTDPYERAPVTSNTYFDWELKHSFILYPVLANMGRFVDTFREFPPAQHPDSFTIDDAIKHVSAAAGGH